MGDVRATFEVVGSAEPDSEGVTADFKGNEVVVTGTIDTDGCSSPMLETLRHDKSDGRVRLFVTESEETELGTTCSDEGFEYRSTVTVEGWNPTEIQGVHDYESSETTTFFAHKE